jgi:tripartite-type tricarboxylate transporter receptor subunit TctC
MFGDAIKLKPEAVHYKSTADALGGLFSGDVQGVFASVGLAAPNVKAGKLVALGSTGATRTGALPDVPTIKEQGYNNLEFSSWFGIVAPSKVPADIQAKLSADVQKAVKSADTKAKLSDGSSLSVESASPNCPFKPRSWQAADMPSLRSTPQASKPASASTSSHSPRPQPKSSALGV